MLSSWARHFSLTVRIFIQGPVIQRADNVIKQIHCYTAKIYWIEIFPADGVFRPLNKLNGCRNISWQKQTAKGTFREGGGEGGGEEGNMRLISILFQRNRKIRIEDGG